jgi:hypothetical protein
MAITKIWMQRIRKIGVLSIYFFSTSLFSPAVSVEPDRELFFEIKELESLELNLLWHTTASAETLSAQKAVVKFWNFNRTYQKSYTNNDVPTAIILLGSNHINEKPIGFLVFGKRSANLVLAQTGTPEGYHNNSLFALKFKESGCQACEEGRVLILKDKGEFVLETENILMKSIDE